MTIIVLAEECPPRFDDGRAEEHIDFAIDEAHHDSLQLCSGSWPWATAMRACGTETVQVAIHGANAFHTVMDEKHLAATLISRVMASDHRIPNLST